MATSGASLILASGAVSDRQTLSDELIRAGLTVREAESAKDALSLYRAFRPSLLCLHQHLAGSVDGIELTRRIRSQDLIVPIILAAECRSEELLLRALRAGANDFLDWPPLLPELLDRVAALLGQRAWRAGPAAGVAAEGGLCSAEGFVGETPGVRALHRQITAAARVVSNVLITGETGTGKELVAELIHRNGPRSKGPFVAVSCAAIPEALFESEMFGVVRGAFTGAYANRDGKLKVADGGTLFLDEIGEMPLNIQAKFLRAIERKEVQRLGDHRTSRVDVRLIAATNQDPEDLVRQQKFRQDLFFRLNVLRIALPPLRERPSDIPLLAAHFLRELSAQLGGHPRVLHAEVLELLCRYCWPGNVRELRNVLEAAAARASATLLSPEDLPADFRLRLDQVGTAGQTEKDLLLSALTAVNWDKSKAARRLRWSRATLYRKLARYSIATPSPTRIRS